MSTETYEYEKINAKDKPIAEDFVYVYSEIEDGGFRKVSKAMLKVLLGVATKLSELENDKAFITKTVLDLENYYLKSDTYSKDEIDNRISLIPRFDVQVVSSLPTTNISETTVYLVSSGDDSDNLYTEYINVNGLWEILGTQKIASVENAVLYTEQSLTEEQKTQARTNISAASSEEVRQLEEEIVDFPYIIATKHGISTESEDNTPALQTLVDEVSSNGGGIIFFPSGRYKFKISSAGGQQGILYPNNVSIIGENVSNTILAQVGNTRFSLFYKVASSDSPVTGCSFSNFTVDGSELPNDGTPTGKAFFFQYVEDCVFRDLCLKNTIATAMGIDYLNRVIIDNVNCVNCGRAYDGDPIGCSGIGIGTGGWENENFTITNCICVESGQYGIFIENQKNLGWGGNVTYSKGAVISNCIVRNGKNHGIGVRGGENVTIIGCESYENTANGIYIDNKCKNVKIISCSAIKNKINGLCVDADTDSIGIIVKDCVFVNNVKQGIQVNTSVEKLCISNAYTYGNAKGMSIGNLTLNDCVLHNNMLLDGYDILAEFTGIIDYNDYAITVPPTSISANDVRVGVGGKIKINYNVTPINANKSVTYKTSEKSIATVDADGYVYGVKEGTCTITITSVENESVSTTVECTVSVLDTNEIIIENESFSQGTVISSTGEETSKNGGGVTDYFEVVGGERTIKIYNFKPSEGGRIVYYNSSKEFIGEDTLYYTNGNSYITYMHIIDIPTDAMYARVSLNVLNDSYVVIGNIDTSIEVPVIKGMKINPDGTTEEYTTGYVTDYIDVSNLSYDIEIICVLGNSSIKPTAYRVAQYNSNKDSLSNNFEQVTGIDTEAFVVTKLDGCAYIRVFVAMGSGEGNGGTIEKMFIS